MFEINFDVIWSTLFKEKYAIFPFFSTTKLIPEHFYELDSVPAAMTLLTKKWFFFPFFYRYKDANPVDPSSTVGIFNDGTELRISTIRHEDIGDYTCIARNGEGQVSHTARVIIAGGAVIMVKTNNHLLLTLQPNSLCLSMFFFIYMKILLFRSKNETYTHHSSPINNNKNLNQKNQAKLANPKRYSFFFFRFSH